MWPLNAYVGQRVVGLENLTYNGLIGLEKGKVYAIRDIKCHPNRPDVPYFRLGADDVWTRWDLVRPVDETRLDVFRAMLKVKHAKDKVLDREDA